MVELSLATIAARVASHFETRTRIDGTEYWCRDSNEQDWIFDMCRDAHGKDFGPDDHRYQMIVNALNALAEDDEDIEPPTYTSELTRWLCSNSRRTYYCNDAMKDGQFEDITDILKAGWSLEQSEVLDSVRSSIQAHWDELESYNPEFSRFDVLEAHWCWACDFGEYAEITRMQQMGFKPSPLLNTDRLNENAAAIYRGLVRK